MPFKEFDKRAATASKSPFVTHQRRGPFSMNRAAFELMGEPEAVTLLYDEEEQLIGFKPADSSNPRSFPVRPQGKNAATLMIAGQSFSKHFGLDTSIARRYSVEMRDGVLVLDLKSDSVDATGPRLKTETDEASEL
jgi:hypothetical protein